MTIHALYPVTMSTDPHATAGFYRDLLGLETSFEADWYVSLATSEGDAQFATVARDHPSVPAGFGAAPAGSLVTVEVSSSDDVRTRARAMRSPIELELRDEAWGQRHFITRDPDGLLVDIVQVIPASEEYAVQYSEKQGTA